jgi:ubiquinone/menaquinone biosynthesis C-methylase UbiE
MTYRLEEHLGYVADAVRLDRYRSAIAAVVRPGDRVLELGCGTGVLGLLCLKAGAGFVEAVDATEMIDVARASFERAGFGDRVRCTRSASRDVRLDERADLVVCDQVGFFGFDYGIVETLRDARHRLLKPGGRVMPRRLELEVAPVTTGVWDEKIDRWSSSVVPPELRWLRDSAAHVRYPVRFRRRDVLGAPVRLGSIDLERDDGEYVSWRARLRVEREAELNGIGGWFSCELAPGVTMTSSPLVDDAIQRAQAFFPLPEAVSVNAGEEILVTLRARPADELIAWTVELPSQGRTIRQSSSEARPVSTPRFGERGSRVAQPNGEDAARAVVVGLCDGRRSVEEVEAIVLRDHAALLPSRDALVRLVSSVLRGDAP